MLLVLRFLEVVQCRQRFLAIRLMPCRHRIEIHHVRANPRFTKVVVNFCFGGFVNVVFACNLIHLLDDLFRVTQLNHRLPDGLVADETVVDAVTFLPTTPLFEVDLLYCTVCIQVLSHTCDRVATPSSCRSSGWKTNPTRMRCTSCLL